MVKSLFNFFRPTKIKGITFTAVVVVTQAVFVLLGNLFLSEILFGQVFWLYVMARFVGIDTTESSPSYLPAPNALGWLLLATGSILTLALYYTIACAITLLVQRDRS